MKLGQLLGVQLDPARPRVEPARRAAVTVGLRILAVVRGQGHAHAGRLGAELLERHTARRELVAPRGVDVAVPEVLAQPQACREREDDLQVRARLATRRRDGGPQLHE